MRDVAAKDVRGLSAAVEAMLGDGFKRGSDGKIHVAVAGSNKINRDGEIESKSLESRLAALEKRVEALE